jgi:Spy/CpxP family protein refolding chaperone
VKEMKSRKEAIAKNHRSQVQSLLTSEQKAQIEKAKQERKANFQERSKDRFETMKTNLGLSDAQASQIEKNRKASMEKMKAIRENTSLSDEQKKTQMMDLRKQQKEQMKSILTEEQLKKLKEGKHGRKRSKTITK